MKKDLLDFARGDKIPTWITKLLNKGELNLGDKLWLGYLTDTSDSGPHSLNYHLPDPNIHLLWSHSTVRPVTDRLREYARANDIDYRELRESIRFQIEPQLADGQYSTAIPPREVPSIESSLKPDRVFYLISLGCIQLRIHQPSFPEELWDKIMGEKRMDLTKPILHFVHPGHVRHWGFTDDDPERASESLIDVDKLEHHSGTQLNF